MDILTKLSHLTLMDLIKWLVIIVFILGIAKFLFAVIFTGIADWIDNSPKLEAKRQKKLLKEQKKEGEGYEKYVSKKLSLLGAPLRNVIVPHANGNDTECDIVYVNTKGVWIVECKERGRVCDKLEDRDQGQISGHATSDEWTFCPRGGNIYAMHNPLLQNAHHIEAITSLLGSNGIQAPIHNLVVMNCHFLLSDFGRDISDSSSNGYYDLGDGRGVLRLGDGKDGLKTFRKSFALKEDALTDDEVMRISSILQQYVASKEKKLLHDRLAEMHEDEHDDYNE